MACEDVWSHNIAWLLEASMFYIGILLQQWIIQHVHALQPYDVSPRDFGLCIDSITVCTSTCLLVVCASAAQHGTSSHLADRAARVVLAPRASAASLCRERYMAALLCRYVIYGRIAMPLCHGIAMPRMYRYTAVGEACTETRAKHVCGAKLCAVSTANLRTKILDFRGSDPSRILLLRDGIHRPKGDLPESLSQAIFVGISLVGRLGALARRQTTE